MHAWARWAARELITYALIAADLALGILVMILAAGLVPGDRLDFNVLGSLVVIAVAAPLWYWTDRSVRRRLEHGR